MTSLARIQVDNRMVLVLGCESPLRQVTVADFQTAPVLIDTDFHEYPFADVRLPG
jgi:hypothetical protein